MKHYLLPFLAAICLATACNDEKQKSTTTDTANVTSETKPASEENTTKPKDEAAIATVETDDYILKIHKAIPFVPDDAKTAGAFKPKEGNQYIALDISVKSKSSQSIEMGSIMLSTEITDEKGTKLGGTVPVLTAYSLTYPDANFQNEYDAIWNDFASNEFHRTTALGFEAPKDAKTFTVKVPVKAYASEKKEATFTL